MHHSNLVLLSANLPYRELSIKEFNSNDTKGPRSVSAFITKISELAPRLVIKQMTTLVRQLDSEVLIPDRMMKLFLISF